MYATATTPVTSLLTGIDLDADALRKACDELELEIEEFSAWQSHEIATTPVLGCGGLCFRDPESDTVAA